MGSIPTGPTLGRDKQSQKGDILKKIVLAIAAVFVMLLTFVGTGAQAANTYPTYKSQELFTYGGGDQIGTWAVITHRKQDDGDGTAIESYGPNTISYCPALGPNALYTRVHLTVKDWETGKVLATRDHGSDYACNSVHDIEIGTSEVGDSGWLGVTVTFVSCVDGGNDQLISSTWKVGGSNAYLGHRSRSTWNVC